MHAQSINPIHLHPSHTPNTHPAKPHTQRRKRKKHQPPTTPRQPPSVSPSPFLPPLLHRYTKRATTRVFVIPRLPTSHARALALALQGASDVPRAVRRWARG
ncbi:hypothetical protein BKA81DRAFT_355578 [Phyllosticta paracitricarpa]